MSYTVSRLYSFAYPCCEYQKLKYVGYIFQIQTHKLDIKAQSKIGSLDNIKHRAGGGDKKIFDDKEYLKNIDHPITPTPPSQVN